MKAVPYLRWSSGKQTDGSSEYRQRQTLEDFCQEEGWPISHWLTDDGVSAWKGDNTRVGDLAGFLERVKLEGGDGLVLVVETQDRLSRMNELDFFEWFNPVLRTGLTVAFCDNGMIVDQQSIRNQKRQIRRIFDNQEEANTYVEKLASRVRGGYARLRENGGIVHNDQTCPRWLEIVYGEKLSSGRRVRVGFKWIPERVEILNRIFCEIADGHGYRAVAKRLNEERVPTWKNGRHWHSSTVRALINDRAVLGVYQHKSRRLGIAAIGEPIPDYFCKADCPQAISDELFQRAHDPRLRQVLSRKSQGDKYRDLLANLTRCHACGSRMFFQERRHERAATEHYLTCDGYKHGRKCDQRRRVRYDVAERLILDSLLTLAMDDQFFQNDADIAAISSQLVRKRRVLEDVAASLNGLSKVLETRAEDERLLERYDSLVSQERYAKHEIRDLEKELATAKGSASPDAHIMRVNDIRKDAQHFDPERRLRARKTIKLALNDLIDRYEFMPGSQIVKWPHQTHRRYPNGVPAGLHYVPTEPQTAVIVLRGALRVIHVDIAAGQVLADAQSENDVTRKTRDPILAEYRRRRAAS